MADFSVQIGLEPVYDGTLNAEVFEIPDPADPDTFVPTNLIRTTQSWFVHVVWEMHGILASWLNADFEIRVYAESIGPGPEPALPVPGPVLVNTQSVPLLMPGFQRHYHTDIRFDPPTLPAGVYKLAVVVQLHDDGSSLPVPVAGMIEFPLVTFFEPHG